MKKLSDRLAERKGERDQKERALAEWNTVTQNLFGQIKRWLEDLTSNDLLNVSPMGGNGLTIREPQGTTLVVEQSAQGIVTLRRESAAGGELHFVLMWSGVDWRINGEKLTDSTFEDAMLKLLR